MTVPAPERPAWWDDELRRLSEMADDDVADLVHAAHETTAAREALSLTWQWTRGRVSFGQPLAEQQAVRFRLADLAARIDGAQELVYEAVASRRASADDPASTAAACLQAQRILRQTARECLHLHGAAGYLAGHPVQAYLAESFRPSARGGEQRWLTVLAQPPGKMLDAAATYRDRVLELAAHHPEVFGAEAWDDPSRQPPGRQAIGLLGEAGLLAPVCVPLPGDLGSSAQLHEALALLPAGAAVLTHVEVGTRLLAAFPSDPAAVAAMRGAAEGRRIAALAVTEPGGGMDFDAMTTTLTPHADRLLLTGEKWFSSNAPFADELLVLARDARMPDRTPGRHSLVRVPVNAPGVTVEPLNSLGHRGLTGRIRLHEVRLKSEAVLGAPGSGLLTLMKHWTHERVMLAVRATAMAAGLLDALSAADIPPPGAVRHAELSAELLQEQAASRRALDLLAEGRCTAPRAAGNKLRAVTLLRRMAEFGLDYGGAQSALADRVLRDAAGLSLAGGSDEALLILIARGLR